MRTSHYSHIIFSRFLLSCAVVKQSRRLFRILIWNKWKAGFRNQKEGLNYSLLAETRGLATSTTERTCVPEKLPKFIKKQKHANRENKAKELKKVLSSILLHTFTQNAVAIAGEHDFPLQERCFTHHSDKHVSECMYLKHPCGNDWGEEVWWIWKTVCTSGKFLAKPLDVSYFPCFKSTKSSCTVLENQGFKVWEKSKYAHITELSIARVRNTRKKEHWSLTPSEM